MGFYSFVVLSSIGASIIVLALVRHLPSEALLAIAVAVFALIRYRVSALPVPLRAIFTSRFEPGISLAVSR